MNSSGILTNEVQLAFSILLAAASIVGVVMVHRKERQNRIRAKFRGLLQARIRDATSIEERFADIISNAIINDDFETLRGIKLGPYVDGYIIDLTFKRKLCNILLGKLKEHHVTGERLSKFIDAINHWRESSCGIEKDIISYLEDLNAQDKSVQPVLDFVKKTSRKGYFGGKTDQFVKDVQHAVEVAADESPKISYELETN